MPTRAILRLSHRRLIRRIRARVTRTTRWAQDARISRRLLAVIAAFAVMPAGCAYEKVSSFHTEEDIRKSDYRVEKVSPRRLDHVTDCMAQALRDHTTIADEHPHAAIQVETSALIDRIALKIPGPLIDQRYRQEGTLLYLIENRTNETTGITYYLWVNPLIEPPGPQEVLTEVDGLVQHCL